VALTSSAPAVIFTKEESDNLPKKIIRIDFQKYLQMSQIRAKTIYYAH
jgi:hypothetical protein